MPPATWGSTAFLISWDDLPFLLWPSVLIHFVWILIDTSKMAHYSVFLLDIPPSLLNFDAGLCALVILVDVVIASLASQGAVMQPRRHEGCLKCFISLRIGCGFGLFCIYAYAIGVKAVLVIREWSGEDIEHAWEREANLRSGGMKLSGWGKVERSWWVVFLVQLIVFIRLVVVVPAACFLCAMAIPKRSMEMISTSGVTRALNAMGVRSEMTKELIKVMQLVVGQGTSDIAVPSDILFGCELVAAHQRQGVFYSDHADTSDAADLDIRSPTGAGETVEQFAPDMLKSHQRAALVRSATGAPHRGLSPDTNELDRRTLIEINHYVHMAIGIYGLALEVFTASVYPHTSILSPRNACGAVCRALRCCRPAGPRVAVGDQCCGANEAALHRAIADGCRLNDTKFPTLVWATWENRGAGTSPPLAVLLDHETRSLVVAVRGTMDAKDCVADLTASPAFFDPLGMSGPSDAREPPFDSEHGLYVHSTILCCARDALERLTEAGLSDSLAPGREAHGWGVVCVGHSLGAGVACLLALLLRGTGKPEFAEARAVVFEPPGGLLSKRLAEATGRLGFVAAVCSHDWISRLSVRAVQELRERVLDELHGCDRSKMQLAMIAISNFFHKSRGLPCCLRLVCCCCGIGPMLSRLFLRLGGGPLKHRHEVSDPKLYRQGYSRVRGSSAGVANSAPMSSVGGALPSSKSAPAAPSSSSAEPPSLPDLAAPDSATARQGAETNGPVDALDLFPELWPPASVIYFRPVASEKWLCGLYTAFTEWTAEWIGPADLYELILSPRSAELHFPNILRDSYRSAGVRLGALERQPHSAFSDSDTTTEEEDEEDESESSAAQAAGSPLRP
mmetsp:Transcript_110796/g.320202  ORF Transcript_110796/g.320202 Transcript_110796/m.320202 type:complete len:850 (+) Transcript_110796:50-2599(+)